jgi:hypothetical protein
MVMTFLDFLNENSGAFTVIFSALVAVATLSYAILTWRLVSETRRMRQAQTEPKISISIQPKEEFISFIDMVIQNIGLGPAYDIRFELRKDFEYEKGKFLSELNLIKTGVKYLAPNQKYQFFFTSMVDNFDEKVRQSFEIKVGYRNSVGKNFENTYTIGFSELIGLTRLGEPSLYKIAKNIEKMQQDISKLVSGFHRIKTIVYTTNDIKEEEKQLLEQYNERQRKEK